MDSATARLIDPSTKDQLGSAFAVSLDCALTAFHCIGDLVSNEPIPKHNDVILQFPDGTEVPAKYSDGDRHLDVALLRLTGQLSHRTLPIVLGDIAEPGTRYRAFGYPAMITGAIGFAVSGPCH